MDSRFAKVAAMIASGTPPHWLIARLARFSQLIGHQAKSGPDAGVQETLTAIDRVEKEVLLYSEMGERFDFIDIPDCIDAVSQSLHEFRDFLKGELRPSRKGGPTPDDRRRLCAAVCLLAWQEVHGKPQPYSKRLQEACEEYWQACGQAATSTEGRTKNWEPFLLGVTDGEGTL